MDQHQLSPEEKSVLIKELWTRGDLEPLLHSKQKEINQKIKQLPTEVDEILLLISRRFGKSVYSCVLALETCIQYPGSKVAIIGPSKVQTQSIVVPLIQKLALSAPEGLITQTKSQYKWTVGQSELVMAGFEQALEALRGQEFQLVILEESGLSNPEQYEYTLDSVIRPCLLHAKNQGGILGKIVHATTPSRHIEHPLHTITIPKTQALNSFFKYTIEDNPLLTKKQIEAAIEEAGGRNSVACQREYFCELTRDTSIVVVPEFDKQIHIQNVRLPEHFRPQITIDFGGTRDKTCALYHYWDYLQSKYVIYDELHWDNQTQTNTIITDIKNKWKDWSTAIKYVDSPGQLKIDLGSQYNYPCISVSKLKFDESIASLRKPFHEDNIVINSTCSFLISTLENGTFNSNRNDFARTAALGHMDALAGLTYAIRHTNKSNPIPPVKASNNTYSEHQEGHPLLSIFN